MTGLDDILSGQDPAPRDDAQTAPPEREVAREPDREERRDYRRRSPDDDLGRDTSSTGEGDGGTPPPAAPPADKEPEIVPRAALLDERSKRQEYERRVRELETQLQGFQQPAAARLPAEAPRDFFEDPDAALRSLREEMSAEVQRTRIDMSAQMARSQYQDYDDAEAAFLSAVKANPALYQQMLEDPHPAGFAYRVGKQMQALAEIGNDPAAYREKLRSDLEAELRAKFEAEQGQRTAKVRQQIPPTLAGARDTAGRFAPIDAGVTPLDDILAPRR